MTALLANEPRLIGRRAELLAELFLQDLSPAFVARPTSDFAYDFFVGIQNSFGGINNFVVEVKGTEEPIVDNYLLETGLYRRLAHSNIPALLLLIDVKRNEYFYAWPTKEILEGQKGLLGIKFSVKKADQGTSAEILTKVNVATPGLFQGEIG